MQWFLPGGGVGERRVGAALATSPKRFTSASVNRRTKPVNTVTPCQTSAMTIGTKFVNPVCWIPKNAVDSSGFHGYREPHVQRI